MISKMKLIGWLLMVVLLQSCGLKGYRKDSDLRLSALYDPPTVTLKPNKVYQFEEGTLSGRGQKFHSDYSYRRAIVIGSQNQ